MSGVQVVKNKSIARGNRMQYLARPEMWLSAQIAHNWLIRNLVIILANILLNSIIIHTAYSVAKSYQLSYTIYSATSSDAIHRIV